MRLVCGCGCSVKLAGLWEQEQKQSQAVETPFSIQESADNGVSSIQNAPTPRAPPQLAGKPPQPAWSTDHQQGSNSHNLLRAWASNCSAVSSPSRKGKGTSPVLTSRRKSPLCLAFVVASLAAPLGVLRSENGGAVVRGVCRRFRPKAKVAAAFL